ncbi:MAG: hypothetical protein ACTXOO_01475 [Sodalis sp. (in: enterobacteria)]
MLPEARQIIILVIHGSAAGPELIQVKSILAVTLPHVVECHAFKSSL